ncbi:hypothetical protein RMSM_07686 [Rhodopirellula maiorica SM1]|uniref:Lipoprotein n=1 Tax=Rhodopirellula maiorica SM1 TaxID=1265738 RepID=M5RN44_9BACT|nr:hypothetical protein [Rhodopirellula maiorica]EMI15394.1 hypothetical protein RMSM_07686 [Rhodopirellula maiorica SM1]
MIRILQLVAVIGVAAGCGQSQIYEQLAEMDIPQWTEVASSLLDPETSPTTPPSYAAKFVLIDVDNEACRKTHGVDRSELQKQVWARDMLDVTLREIKPGTHYDAVVRQIGEPERVAMGKARDSEGVVTYVWLDEQVGMTMLMFNQDRLAAVLPCW